QRLERARIWEDAVVGRWAGDIAMDMNRLLDQRVYLQQDENNTLVRVRGRLPSALNTEANILRYQQDIRALGSDANILIFLDANQAAADENVTGVSNVGLQWRFNFDTNRVVFIPLSDVNIPNAIDINLAVESSYSSVDLDTLSVDGNVPITIRYSDQNTSHASTITGYLNENLSYVLTWWFEDDAVPLVMTLSRNSGGRFGMKLDTNANAVPVTYSVAYSLDSNAEISRAGYDFPLTILGSDSNYFSDAIWVTG
ncbi:MAG: hypothetical protein AABY11_02780, partial [archaeon]